jgi:hypothetical protein
MASYTTYTENMASLSQALLPHPKYVKQASGKLMFSLTLAATTTGVAAGNIVAATAAAATQFALTNPSTSNKNLVLTKFFMGIISGTPSAGPIFHGYMTTNPTIASIGGTILNNFLGNSTASVATPHALAAGSALTGGSAPITFRPASFSTTATAQASVGEVNCLEILDGDIIVPPGVTWLPLWSAAGTSVLNSYAVTWYETGV